MLRALGLPHEADIAILAEQRAARARSGEKLAA